MKTKSISLAIIATLLWALSATPATRVSNVRVDFVKGYASTITGTDTTYSYMGRVTYVLVPDTVAQPVKDSVWVSLALRKAADSTQVLPLTEAVGDIGVVKRTAPGDTLKTIYFRTPIAAGITESYVAAVTVSANVSQMWKLADTLMKQMSLTQRQQMTYAWTSSSRLQNFGSDNYTLPNGTVIVGWRCSDGPHGVRFPLGPASGIAYYGTGDTMTLFPTEAAIGCTWDTSLARRIGQAIGQEARSEGLFCNLGPMCDLVINPCWGRAFETMGEDPYLNGKMVVSQVIGLQSEKVIATPKHFMAYVREVARTIARVFVSERSLRELFGVPFEMAIHDGGARALMTCYNRVNVPGYTPANGDTISAGGEQAATNRHLISDIARRDWGFDGVIMTDWQGAANSTEAYAYYTDFDMSMPSGAGFLHSANNVSAGTWNATPLNNRARRCMYDRLWAWGGQLLANDNQINTYPPTVRHNAEHIALSLEAARKSIVLAKNDVVNGTPVLPLAKTGSYKLAVVGPFADLARQGGGGSSAVTPDSMITPLQGIRKLLGAGSSVTITTDYTTLTPNDVAIVVVGVDKEGEDEDRSSMALPKIGTVDQNALVASVMAKTAKTIVIYTGGSASCAGNWSNAPGVIIAFYPGRNQGQAMAEVLFGDVNPSGHLNVTFPVLEGDLPGLNPASQNLRIPRVDSAHGYFYCEKTGKTPLFRFGHGLSYTSFTFSGLSVVGGTSISAGDRIDISATVKNTGIVKGDDVAQLYIQPLTASSYPRRVKDLRGFARVSLDPGATQAVRFTLGPRDFSVYDTSAGKFTVVPGAYAVVVGSTSDPAELFAGNGKSVSATITVN